MRKYLQKAAVLCALLLAVCLLPGRTVRAEAETAAVSAVASDETEADVTEIRDAAGLRAIADAPDGNYRLAADIDMSGADWTPIPFSGRLDGAGHTLYNLRVTDMGTDVRTSIDGNLKKYKTRYAGLFSVVENAEIKDLRLVGAEVDIHNDTHCFAAILAGYADQSSFADCSVQGRVHMTSQGVNVGVAGLVGFGWVVIDRCSADVELVFVDEYRTGRCEEFMGGALACGIGNIRNCRIAIQGYDSCHGYVHNGGLVGMYYHCGVKKVNRDVTDNYSEGQITFFENNPNRRAYCDGMIGERLSGCRVFSRNKTKFKRNEVFRYNKTLLPEDCASPHYTEAVTPPTCTEWGYTVHTCDGCGYHWTDSYTPPQHTPGDWTAAGRTDESGHPLEQRICTVCGAVTEERAAQETAVSQTDTGAGSRGVPWWVLLGAALLGGAVLTVLGMAVRQLKRNR